ncbi:hypothetical protein GCM10010381_44720 [Streptomyces xantholiticus]|nr:hypothetical protein [Streptomyces xantholiticus]GGW54273.1 hypothetical protein GCM10010381_44720 [Streptomyces xantholiticus]
MHVAPTRTATVHDDHVALAEIELCGELMIAASAAAGERLSADRIDEVLMVAADRARCVDRGDCADMQGLTSPRQPGPGGRQTPGRRRA